MIKSPTFFSDKNNGRAKHQESSKEFLNLPFLTHCTICLGVQVRQNFVLWDCLRPNILGGTKSAFTTHKRCGVHLCPFYMGVYPPSWGNLSQTCGRLQQSLKKWANKCLQKQQTEPFIAYIIPLKSVYTFHVMTIHNRRQLDPYQVNNPQKWTSLKTKVGDSLYFLGFPNSPLFLN